MKIGFSQKEITPSPGIELGGYALYRPCAGVHDPLLCKAVVLEQGGVRYALVALDLVSVDEALYHRIADRSVPLGLCRERMTVCAIHTHSGPWGNLPGEGPLEKVNREWMPQSEAFSRYMEQVVRAAGAALTAAVEALEPFQVRTARGAMPAVGSNRHDGSAPRGDLLAMEFRTDSGKTLVVYNFACHPTVLNGENLLASADFVGGVHAMLDADQTVFLNGAAGDISTRFTRKSSSFDECQRMARITAESIRSLLAPESFARPAPLRGFQRYIPLKARPVITEAEALALLTKATEQWQQAVSAGRDPGECRLRKSYVEGAQVNLQMSRSMEGIRELTLPVNVFRFCGQTFASVPGELFSSLLPGEPLAVIGYANGYYRYLPSREAYDSGCYEALAALIHRGEGERLMEEIRKLITQLG